MTSPDAPAADEGLLSPVSAGSEAETATGDRAFLQAMLDAEAALTRAQYALGRAPGEAAKAVTAAARAELYDVRDLALRARSGGNPVIPLVADLTAEVARADREAAAYVHRGATSQDILDSALMLMAARTVRLVAADLERTATALARIAAGHRDTPMAGRTLTQHAVPTTFGLKAAGWRSLVLDARDRLDALRLPAQLGGAAGTLAAFAAYAQTSATGPEAATGAAGTAGRTAASVLAAPTRPASMGRTVDANEHGHGPATVPVAGGPHGDAEAPLDIGIALLGVYADEIGLAEPSLPWHTLRTPVADLGAALGFVCGALGKLAADVLVLSRTEVSEVAEGSGGGSSAMPHKANPVRATLIAAAARRGPALAGVLLACLAAEDERAAGAWHAEWQTLRELLRLAAGAAGNAAELTRGLRVIPYRMREQLDLTEGLIVSERCSEVLGPLIGRGRARELLTGAARRATAEAVPLAEILADEPELAAVLTPRRLDELVDPTRYTGSAAALVDRALRRDRERPETL
ncbi:lyase family protein [Streptomyces niveus]|uniref:lyase family protein n=1 Tax=Streptomyces niveus TaxID=193462 RepID=UPI0033E54B39